MNEQYGSEWYIRWYPLHNYRLSLSSSSSGLYAGLAGEYAGDDGLNERFRV